MKKAKEMATEIMGIGVFHWFIKGGPFGSVLRAIFHYQRGPYVHLSWSLNPQPLAHIAIRKVMLSQIDLW